MNAIPAATLLESYVRTPDFEEHAAALELSPALWDIFARTEARATAADIARDLGIEPTVAHLGLRELAAHKLLRTHVQRWRDHRATNGLVHAAELRPAPLIAFATVPPEAPATIPPEPTPSPRPIVPVPVAPPPVAVQPAPVAPSPGLTGVTVPESSIPVASSAGVPREIRFTFGPPPGRRRPAATAPGLISLSLRRSPSAPAPAKATESAPANGWPLRPILDAIGRQGGGGVTGQLLAYRVFLRIPAELLDRAGLHSLNLADDGFTIHDPELYAALSRSAREVAGVEIATATATSEPTLLARS